MATLIQNEVMKSSYVPYERPPQSITLWSAIPRGLQTFYVDNQLLDVKPVNDAAILNLTATLPPNFGYVMQDANFNLSTAFGADWDSYANLNLQNFYRLSSSNDALGLSGNWVQEKVQQAANSAQVGMRVRQPWPSFPIIGTPGSSGILVVMTMSNTQAQATTAGTINAFIAFWQFDLEQIRKYPINSPIPVQLR